MLRKTNKKAVATGNKNKKTKFLDENRQKINI